MKDTTSNAVPATEHLQPEGNAFVETEIEAVRIERAADHETAFALSHLPEHLS